MRQNHKSGGNGNGWVLWVNTVLVLAVTSLLGLLWASTTDRFNKLEAKLENQSRIERIEEQVRNIGLDQARGAARVESLEGRIQRNREDIERLMGRR